MLYYEEKLRNKESEYMLELEENKQKVQTIKNRLQSIGDSL